MEPGSSCKSVFLLCLSHTCASSIIDVGDESPQGPSPLSLHPSHFAQLFLAVSCSPSPALPLSFHPYICSLSSCQPIYMPAGPRPFNAPTMLGVTSRVTLLARWLPLKPRPPSVCLYICVYICISVQPPQRPHTRNLVLALTPLRLLSHCTWVPVQMLCVFLVGADSKKLASTGQRDRDVGLKKGCNSCKTIQTDSYICTWPGLSTCSNLTFCTTVRDDLMW